MKEEKANFESFVERVEKVGSLEELQRLEQSSDSLWNWGVFSDEELAAADALLMDKRIRIVLGESVEKDPPV